MGEASGSGGAPDLGIDGLSDYRRLATGGFATVYWAWEADAGRPVAVKVLGTTDEAGRRRFDRERQLIGRTTSHPHIVTMFRSGYLADGAHPYLVLEFVDGGSLQNRLDTTGPLPWDEAIGVLLPIADALRFSHGEGILHRDLKPGNILLSTSGVAKLTDFGIAAMRDVTSTQQLAFSMPFAAPETFESGLGADGRTVDLRDERSDLYSLAATLFAAGVGHPPFAGASPAAVLRQVLDGPPPTTGRTDLDRFLATAMAKDPAERHPRVEVFIEELSALLGAGPGTGGGPAVAAGPGSPATPHPSMVAETIDGPVQADGNTDVAPLGAVRSGPVDDGATVAVDPAAIDAELSTPDPAGAGDSGGRPIDRRVFLAGAIGALGVAGAAGLAIGLGRRSDDETTTAAPDTGATSTSTSTTVESTTTTTEPPAPDYDVIAAQAVGQATVVSLFGDLATAQAGLDDAIDLIRSDDLAIEVGHRPWSDTEQTLELMAGDAAVDIHGWSGGLRFPADDLRLADLSELWAGGLTEKLGEPMRDLVTSGNGQQRFVPWTQYLWAVHYRRSAFEERDYAVPGTWEELVALADRMVDDGLTPFAFANDGGWPAMGTFDYLDLRLNGHRFHLDLLAGAESWQDDRVRAVFDRFAQLLPYHQAEANTRSWGEAATALADGTAGMYLCGTFVRDGFPRDLVGDLDFFPFPQLDPQHGVDVVVAPVDGWVLASGATDDEAARAVLYRLGTAEVQDRFRRRDRTAIMANPELDISAYDPLAAKVAATLAGASALTQFLDRDTDPRFAADVVGPALAAFIDDPARLDELLADVDDQARQLLGP